MQLIQHFNSDLLDTFVIFIVFVVGYLVTLYLLRKKIHDSRDKNQFHVRLLYVTVILFLLSIIHIWVDGFTKILAVLSLVSAAIVIANKETIMNFTGFFIINWRELFTKNDLVKIQNTYGYVKHIGPLYFTVCEVIGNKVTGNVIRIPNYWVITMATTNYSIPNKLSLQHFELLLSVDSDVSTSKQILINVINHVLKEKYEKRPEFSPHAIKHYRRKLNKQLTLSTSVTLSVAKQDNVPNSIVLEAHYYTLINDAAEIKTAILEHFLRQAKAAPSAIKFVTT